MSLGRTYSRECGAAGSHCDREAEAALVYAGVQSGDHGQSQALKRDICRRMWRGGCCFWRRMIRVRSQIRAMWWMAVGVSEQVTGHSGHGKQGREERERLLLRGERIFIRLLVAGLLSLRLAQAGCCDARRPRTAIDQGRRTGFGEMTRRCRTAGARLEYVGRAQRGYAGAAAGGADGRVGMKHNSTLNGDAFLADALIGRLEKEAEKVTPGPHAWDGSYTSADYEWKGHDGGWRARTMETTWCWWLRRWGVKMPQRWRRRLCSVWARSLERASETAARVT